MSAVFLSGAMSNLPNCNYPAFHKAAQALRARGYRVQSPAENVARPDAKWEDYMRLSLRQLLKSESIVMLDGWQDSRGATLEHQVATALGMRVHRLDELLAQEATC